MNTNMIVQHQPRLRLAKVKMMLIAGVMVSVLIVEFAKLLVGG